MKKHELLLIFDFGSQYTRLIARRVRELGVYSEIVPFSTTAAELRKRRPSGIILSGGPDSIYREGAPAGDGGLFGLGVPVLGICYGMHWMARQLGGNVKGGASREYGSTPIVLEGSSPLWKGLGRRQTVWMSHGDSVEKLPAGFGAVARSSTCAHAAMADPRRKLVGLQFHPEVGHTRMGKEILRNFLYEICGFRGDWKIASFIRESVEGIRARVGQEKILCALSGGVDSTVTAVLTERAAGDRLTCIFVDTGLLRKEEARDLLKVFRRKLKAPVRFVDASERFFRKLEGVEDPEKKRKIIGKEFIAVFEKEASALGGVKFLAQGTLYPDVIESLSVMGPSHSIKTHHNVGGLPEIMGLTIVEPLRYLFKDEVRRVGRELGIDSMIINRHPFPGPGLAVRILGAVTRERAEMLREADAVLLAEIRKARLERKIAQCFCVLLPVRSVGVMGDGRTYENVCAVRAVETEDFMTADWSRIPYPVLARISTRIVNEVRGINRVVYDISTKPPSTIEWE
jgi:GMP synthase (glutamine-hydrolysing)